MNTIQNLAQAIEKATLSVSREKGLASATQWVHAMTSVVATYPKAIDNMQTWITGGASDSTSSGVKYKAKHNKGVFPSEQIFCNTRGKSRRPLDTVCKAVAIALIENRPYNPDRFSVAVSENGLEQSLKQFNRTKESEIKRDIYAALPENGLSGKGRKEIVKLAENATAARSTNDRPAFNDFLEKLATVLEAANKRTKTSPTPAVTKQEQAPTVTKTGRKAKGGAKA